MVEMCDGEDYFVHLLTLCIFFFTPYQGMILYAAELASIASAFKYMRAYLLPVGRVSLSVFGSYRHGHVYLM